MGTPSKPARVTQRTGPSLLGVHSLSSRALIDGFSQSIASVPSTQTAVSSAGAACTNSARTRKFRFMFT